MNIDQHNQSSPVPSESVAHWEQPRTAQFMVSLKKGAPGKVIALAANANTKDELLFDEWKAVPVPGRDKPFIMADTTLAVRRSALALALCDDERASLNQLKDALYEKGEHDRDGLMALLGTLTLDSISDETYSDLPFDWPESADLAWDKEWCAVPQVSSVAAFSVALGAPPPDAKVWIDETVKQLGVYMRSDGDLQIDDWAEIKHPTTGLPYLAVATFHHEVHRRPLAELLCNDRDASMEALETVMRQLGQTDRVALMACIDQSSFDSDRNELLNYVPVEDWPESAEIVFAKSLTKRQQ